jgi:hypothetical protein
MAEGRHREEDKRSPPERPNEGPSGGLTRRKLTDFAIKLSLALLVRVATWLIIFLIIWLMT